MAYPKKVGMPKLTVSTSGGGMATAGLVLGIVSIVFGAMGLLVVPLFVSIPCATIGLPLGGIALAQSLRRGEGTGMAIAAIACCCSGAILSFIMIFIGVAIVAG